MRKFSITKEFDALLIQIRSDIFLLKQTVKDEKRIKISIQDYYRILFEIYFAKERSEASNQPKQTLNFTKIYGIEIVNGYINQICIFDEYAEPEDKFLEPILITL